MDRQTAALCAAILKQDVRALRDRTAALNEFCGLTDWAPGNPNTAHGDLCRARDAMFEAWGHVRAAEAKLKASSND